MRKIVLTPEQMQKISNAYGRTGMRVRSVETKRVGIEWQSRALSDLETWLANASDQSKTLSTWQAVYIRCGACFRSWEAWIAANPIGDDLPGWIATARDQIAKNRWV